MKKKYPSAEFASSRVFELYQLIDSEYVIRGDELYEYEGHQYIYLQQMEGGDFSEVI